MSKSTTILEQNDMFLDILKLRTNIDFIILQHKVHKL